MDISSAIESNVDDIHDGTYEGIARRLQKVVPGHQTMDAVYESCNATEGRSVIYVTYPVELAYR